MLVGEWMVHGPVGFGATIVAVVMSDRWDERLARARGVARLYLRVAAPSAPVAPYRGPSRPAARPRTLLGCSFAARPAPGRMVT